MFQKKHLEDSKILFKISALHTHSTAQHWKPLPITLLELKNQLFFSNSIGGHNIFLCIYSMQV